MPGPICCAATRPRKANHVADAEQYYNAVLNNPRADAQSRQSAQQQVAQLVAGEKAESADGKAAYKQAVDEYRKGLWQQARADFVSAQQLGYTGGFLQANPAEYLRKMDDGERKYASHGKGDGRASYDRAREEYRSGDLASARADFLKARDLGFQPNYLEGLTPSEYLQRMDEKTAPENRTAVADAAAPANISASADASGQTVNLADDSGGNSTPSAPKPGGSDQIQLQHQAEIDRLAEQQRIFKAQGDVDMAKKAEAAGNDSEALSRYTEAVDLDPTNTAAVQGRDRLLAKLGRGSESGRRHPDPHRAADQAGHAGHPVQVQHRHRSGASGHRRQFVRRRRKTTSPMPRPLAMKIPRFSIPTTCAKWTVRFSRRRWRCGRRGRNTISPRRGKMRRPPPNARNSTERQEASRRHAAVTAYIRLSRAQIEQQNYAAASGCSTRFWPSIRRTITPWAFASSSRTRRSFRNSGNIAKSSITTSSGRSTPPTRPRFPMGISSAFRKTGPMSPPCAMPRCRNSNVSKEDQAVQALLDHRLPQVELPNIPSAMPSITSAMSPGRISW